MEIFETLLGLLAACVVLALAARHLQIPLAVVLVLGGMALALIPGLPTVTLDPQLALVLFLPPLLQASAYRTDWPAFRFNLRPILFLALGAVLFTAAAVAVTAKTLVPDLPWAAAVALGAIVAPPDAVAAASVLRDFRIPKRLVVILEGESLLNDASSLVLYRFAVAATLVGEVSLAQASLSFLFAAAAGTLIGYVVGRIAMWVFARLEDTLLDILVSFLAGFAAYLAAEQVHASGVLAAVTCGLVLGQHQHAAFTARTRLEMSAVWGFVEFVLTALVFVLIGLQLRGIEERLGQYDLWHLAGLGLAVSAALIVSRFVWVFPALWLPRALSSSLRERDPMPPWSHATMLSWAGMRGVVSLAAALALPAEFPGRDLILFLAFCAILATLVLQGTTLGPLIRRLGLSEPGDEAVNPAVTPQAIDARSKATVAAMTAVTEKVDDMEPEQAAAAEDLLRELRQRAKRAARVSEDVGAGAQRLSARLDLRLTAIEAARTKLLADHRDDLEHEEMAALMTELDLEEEQIRVAMGER
ncbi:Na+/H+ antiporter [Methylobacterium oxalidis]|uniref:Na+/H+ antiporter n=1 Tax=Methylobacterium oxalidis TaxID=944322 RepID=UPI0033159F9D